MSPRWRRTRRTALGVAAFLCCGACSPGPTTGGAQATGIDCADAIAQLRTAPPGFDVVDDRVGLQLTGRIEVAPAGENAARLPLFGKSALVVRSGSDVEIALLRPGHPAARFIWGRAQDQATTVHLPPCRAATDPGWLVFPGGYWAEREGCLPAQVRVDGRASPVSVPFGTSC